MDKPKGRAAHTFAPVHRLETEPFGAVTSREDREEALRDALRDMDLGQHDERTIEWACTRIDVTTLRTIVSWIERARCKAMLDVLSVEAVLQHHAEAVRRGC